MSDVLPKCEALEGVAETIDEQSNRNQTLGQQALEQNPTYSNPQIEEWETRARAWLSTLPKRRNVTMNEMEAWIDSNQVPLPEELKSLPRFQLYHRFLSIHKLMRKPNQIFATRNSHQEHVRYNNKADAVFSNMKIVVIDKNKATHSCKPKLKNIIEHKNQELFHPSQKHLRSVQMSDVAPQCEAPEGVAETIDEQSNRDQTLGQQALEQYPTYSDHWIQEWETRARAWLSTLPKRRNATINEMEAWIVSNQVSLPEELKSLPRFQLYHRFLSIHKVMRKPNQVKEVIPVEPSPARFQRTDQWIPVYSWLESLDRNEVVKSKEISDWLSKNPSVKEQLYSKHSRYHLMHYVQKCHSKILKRRGKLQKVSKLVGPDRIQTQGVQPSTTMAPMKVLNNGVTTLAVPLPYNSSGNTLKDKDISLAKRNEASRKYELLTDLESQLSSFLSKRKQVNNSREPGSPSSLKQISVDNSSHQ